MHTLSRTCFEISDDAGRIAMLENRTYGSDDSAEKLVRYVYSNHLQSASLELDEHAAVISYEEYHPYGTTAFKYQDDGVKATAKRYRYTGKERDEESGLYYHGARYYVPWLARWCAVDPLEAKFGGRSPFCYGANNPVSYNDPDGQQEKNGDESWHPPMAKPNPGTSEFYGNFMSLGILLPEITVETNRKEKDERIANNTKGHFFGMGMSNNEVALAWANSQWYGGYIDGDTLHYLIGHNAVMRDEYGAQYHTYDDLEWRTIQINDSNFGLFGDKNLSGGSGQSRYESEQSDYRFDRSLRQSYGISSEDFVHEMKVQGALFAIGETLPLMPSLKTGGRTSRVTIETIEESSIVSSGRARQLQGELYESFLQNELHSSSGGFTAKSPTASRQFDGAYAGGNIWYEAKSGDFFGKGFDYEKFKSNIGRGLNVAKANDKVYEVISENPIPDYVKSWLDSKGVLNRVIPKH